MNTLFSAKFFGLFVLLLSLSGCVSYSVTEQEMTDYLNQNLKLDQAVGIEDVLYAKINNKFCDRLRYIRYQHPPARI